MLRLPACAIRTYSSSSRAPTWDPHSTQNKIACTWIPTCVGMTRRKEFYRWRTFVICDPHVWISAKWYGSSYKLESTITTPDSAMPRLPPPTGGGNLERSEEVGVVLPHVASRRMYPCHTLRHAACSTATSCMTECVPSSHPSLSRMYLCHIMNGTACTFPPSLARYHSTSLHLDVSHMYLTHSRASGACSLGRAEVFPASALASSWYTFPAFSFISRP